MAYSSAPTHGKVARFEKNNVAIDFTGGWNINFNIEMSDKSRQGQHWKEGLPGQGSWGGDLSGQLVLGNTEQKALHDNLVTATPGTLLTDLKLLINGTTEGWDGDMYLTGLAVSAPLGGVVDVKIDFQGDGAPTLSDAQ